MATLAGGPFGEVASSGAREGMTPRMRAGGGREDRQGESVICAPLCTVGAVGLGLRMEPPYLLGRWCARAMIFLGERGFLGGYHGKWVGFCSEDPLRLARRGRAPARG